MENHVLINSLYPSTPFREFNIWFKNKKFIAFFSHTNHVVASLDLLLIPLYLQDDSHIDYYNEDLFSSLVSGHGLMFML